MKRYWMIIVICFLVLAGMGTCHSVTSQRDRQLATPNPTTALESSPSASATLVQDRSATAKPLIPHCPTRMA